MLYKNIKAIEDPRLKMVLESLKGLEYGSMQIIVHDSQITQIEKTEKYRFSMKTRQTIKKKIFS